MPKATFKVEISNHGGYCSGEECEYETWVQEEEVEDAEDVFRIRRRLERDMELAVSEPEVNQSFYCENDPEAERNGLGMHGFRITVVPSLSVKHAGKHD